MVAFGGIYAALFSDDEGLARRLLSHASAAGENLWRMPLERRLKRRLKSHVADLKNTGGRYGSSITGALFLHHFVKSTPWAHIDMAGLGMSDETWEHVPKGASGFGVATLTRYASDV